MRKRFYIPLALSVMMELFVAQSALSITPLKLQERLANGKKITMIDIRSQAEYAAGHAQGAINIPSSIVRMKRLPPIGMVVIYGDGIRTDITLEAVHAFNQKKGISAEMLEGGFPAWEAFNLSTSRSMGVDREDLPQISYDDLVKAAKANGDMVLLDLRSKPVVEEDLDEPGQLLPPVPLTELSARFPGIRTAKLHKKRTAAGEEWDIGAAVLAREQKQPHRNLYVLIDEGNGESEKVARRLKSAGIRRIAILIGGERALQRQGKAAVKTRINTQQ